MYNLIGCPRCGRLQINESTLKFKCKFCKTQRIYRNVTVFLFQSNLDDCRLKMLRIKQNNAPSVMGFR